MTNNMAMENDPALDAPSLAKAWEVSIPRSRARPNTQETPWRYHFAAFQHRTACYPLLMGLALGFFNVWLGVVAALLGELVTVACQPHRASFRRSVDAEAERRAAAVMRARVLERMSGFHRDELERLEQLAARIGQRCGRSHAGSSSPREGAVERWLGLEKLVALYVELAVTHASIADAFRVEDWRALEAEIERTKGMDGSHGPTSAQVERRAAILRRRHDTWMDAAAESERIAHELSTIVDVVRWMHEVCAVAQSGLSRPRIDEALAGWEANAVTLREVSALCCTDDRVVDPAVLALGREEMARMQLAQQERGRLESVGASVGAPGFPGGRI